MGRVVAYEAAEAAYSPLPFPTAAYDAHSAPVPPPPRPPRPVKVPGYLLTADTTNETMQWIEQQVFYTHSKTILQSIRQKQPIFLLNAQTQELHGVFQRAPDAQLLQQDLTSPPGPHGYQVHVMPMYEFAVTLELESVEDLLVQQPTSQQPGEQPASNSSSSSSFEPMLGSFQHGAIWEAFMKKAKKHKHMDAILEEEQQQQDGVPPPPPPPPRRAPAAAVAAAAAARGAQSAANGHSQH